ncbi:lysophospholipid acyltransferase family protein [Caldimonas brevitalea]|uniref:Lipid A biosynthesis acyltransferase n=1 Tax=Caldimonas brevitalea TaxID=413882 RepID=A0A0G3BJS2_9BURK|nr:lysophospholipid acyltransferase family protein [Caldimonas brevitalea]AKJ27636.1 lipid A biosynthesis acyltransferase [Caldimonas brevitalea]
MQTLFRFLSHWPLGLLHAIGFFLGWATWWASPTYRRRFRENVAQSGLPWSAVRPAVGAAGKMVMELPWLWFRPADRPLGDKVRWLNSELIEEAKRQGRGVIFLTPHLGCFEVTAQSYAELFTEPGKPITVLYRPARKAAIRPIVETARRRPGLAAAPASLAGVRQMIRALRQGQAVGLLPDQVPPEGLGVWAPFLGRPAYTMTLASRLAQQTGAAVLLVWGERLPRGRGYVVRVDALEPALPEGGADQAQSAAALINRAMERLILQCPEQYLWGYHRYKEPRHDTALSGGAT